MGSNAPISSPTLPEDLERVIFEKAAHDHPLSIPTLLLVAWRVKVWLEPLLYRTIMLSLPRRQETIRGHPVYRIDLLIQLINSDTAPLLKTAVRNLLLCRTTPEGAKAILSACPAVENLYITVRRIHDLFPVIQDLPLRRLHCNVREMFKSQPRLDFTHRLFAHITHLELLDSYIKVGFDLNTWAGIASIPNLSHISFNDARFSILFGILLRRCKSLRVLLLLGADIVAPNLARDVRFVCMRCDRHIQDWQMGAHTGVDYWSRAEEFIAKRKSGEIDPLDFSLQEDRSVFIA